MNAEAWIPLLGLPKKEPGVAALIAASGKAVGVELSLDGGVLGAIFLSPGNPKQRIKPFSGTLPHGLAWGMPRADVALGEPALDEGKRARWDVDGYSLFLGFGDDDALTAVTMQPLVVDYDLDLPNPLHFETQPADPPKDAELVAPALLVVWAIDRGGAPPKHAAHADALASRSITPRAFLVEACGRDLGRDDIPLELLPFVYGYTNRRFLGDEPRKAAKSIRKLLGLSRDDEIAFSDDYLGTFAKQPYFVPDSWAAFDRLAPILDARLADYRATKFTAEPPAGIYEAAAKLRDAHPVSLAQPKSVPVTLAVSTDELLALVGKSLADKAVQAVLARATLPIGKTVDEQAAPMVGLSYMGAKLAGKLAVTAVTFYAKGQRSYIRGLGTEIRFDGYRGALPNKLDFGATHAAVHEALGKPLSPDAEHENWRIGDRRLRCTFRRDKLVEVSWSLPRD